MFCFHDNGRQQTSEKTFFFCDAEVIIYIRWYENSFLKLKDKKKKKSFCTVVKGLKQTSKHRTRKRT